MKKIFTLLSIVTCLQFAHTHEVFAQAFTTDNFHVNAGVGIGGYLDFAYATTGEFSSLPALFVSADKGIVDDFLGGTLGIGGFIGFKSAKYDYSYTTYNETAKWSYTVFGARGTYHYPLDNEQIDLYGGLNLGIWLYKYDYENDDPFFSTFDFDISETSLYYSAVVGAKYFFTDAIGAFAELGWDIAYLKLGVSFNL